MQTQPKRSKQEPSSRELEQIGMRTAKEKEEHPYKNRFTQTHGSFI